MSEYRDMADLFGGDGTQSGPLLEAQEDSALLFSAHINHESRLFRQLEDMGSRVMFSAVEKGAFGWIGDRVSLFVGDAPEGLELDRRRDFLESAAEQIFDSQPGGIRISVRNQLLLGVFLGGVKNLMTSALPGIGFDTLPERHGCRLVRISPEQPLGNGAPEALYYGVIRDGLYVSFNEATLNRVIDRCHSLRTSAKDGTTATAEPPAAAGPSDREAGSNASGETASSWIDDSHVAFSVDLEKAPRWRRLLADLFDRHGSKMCDESIQRRKLLERLWLGSDALQRSFQGGAPRCPLGGTFARDRKGRIDCDHVKPKGVRPGEKNPLRTLQSLRVKLRFTENGVRTTVELKDERVKVSKTFAR